VKVGLQQLRHHTSWLSSNKQTTLFPCRKEMARAQVANGGCSRKYKLNLTGIQMALREQVIVGFAGKGE